MKNTPHGRRCDLTPILIVAVVFARSLASASPDLTPLCQVEPGPIAITSTPNPALHGFDQAAGKATSASESAGNAVNSLLNTPHLGNPQLEAALGVLEFVASPFVAGYGAIKGGHQKLSPDQLTQTEKDLQEAMSKTASQQEFRKLVLAAARTATQRTLVELDPGDSIGPGRRRVSALLEVQVQELQLRRSRNTDKSFRLNIQAHARLIRSSDGAILYDKPLRYQSGESLFVDWAREDGFESVARTGYQALAQQIANDLFSVAANEPILLGEGQRKRSAYLVARTPCYSRNEWRAFARHIPPGAGLQFVDYKVPSAGAIEILPDLSSREFHIQAIAGSPELSSQTPTDTEYALDGLENHPNFVVQVAGCIGAIPMGLWEHTVGATRQGSEEALRAADSILKVNAANRHPQDYLSLEVARRLAKQTSDKVLYNTANSLDESAASSSALAESGIIIDRSAVRPDTRLEIRVVSSALAGKPGRNPRLTLALDVVGTVLRTSDGQELCSWPISYRSAPRRLTAWAARDATCLAQELTRCYDAISGALVSELKSGNFVPPAMPSTLASN